MIVLLLLVTGVKTQARKEGILAMAGALGLTVLFVQFQSRIGLFVRRHFQLGAVEALEEDPRPNILFLRSFQADNQFVMSTSSWLGKLLGKTNMPLEAVLTDQLQDFGPVIAIGRPGEPLPPLGAARFYAPKEGEEWKRHVTEFATDAQLVVVMLGETEGVRWEYDLLARANWLGKTIFIVPPVKGAALNNVLGVFRKYTEDRGIGIMGQVDEDVAVFAPGGNGQLIPLSAQGLRTHNHFLASSANYYREPIAQILKKASASRPATTSLPPTVSGPLPVGAPSDPQAMVEIVTAEMVLADPITEAHTVVLQRRAPALFIDWVISVLAFSLLAFIVLAVNDPAILDHPANSQESEEVNQQVMTVGMFLSPLYFLIMEGLLGVSLGKRWFGVRVVSADGAVPSWRQGALRALMKACSMFLCVFPLAALLGIVGTAWHDSVAKTKVVAYRKGR